MSYLVDKTHKEIMLVTIRNSAWIGKKVTQIIWKLVLYLA